MAKTFEQFVEEERARLTKTREECLAKRQEIDEEIAAVDRELDAIAAYEQVKRGKASTLSQQPRARRTSGARAPRGSREHLKNQIIELVSKHPEGLVSDQINRSLNITDPKQKQQLATVLALLKKEGALHQEQRRGPYTASNYRS
jgi:hypothetical protein